MAGSGFTLLTVIMLVLLFIGLKSAIKLADWEEERKKKYYVIAITIVTLWVVLVSMLGAMNFFSDFEALPPRLFLFIFPALGAILIVTFTKNFTYLLSLIPNSWTIAIQVFRIPIEIFLWLLFLDDILPIQMTFEGRNWDVLTGITAPIIAVIAFRKGKNNKKLAVIWNVFGLILLFNIVITAILSFPTPFRYFMNEPANTIVAYFPYNLLPCFLVPLAFAMHCFSLRQLATKSKILNLKS